MTKLFLIVIILIIGIGIFLYKFNNRLNAYSGTYQGTYSKFVGNDEKDNESFSLVLNKDGTGIHYRNGGAFDVKWNIKGEEFTMTETIMGVNASDARQTTTAILIDYKGTLKEGKLDIYNGDPDNSTTYEYLYEKR